MVKSIMTNRNNIFVFPKLDIGSKTHHSIFKFDVNKILEIRMSRSEVESTIPLTKIEGVIKENSCKWVYN